jgi:poly(A) polymerase
VKEMAENNPISQMAMSVAITSLAPTLIHISELVSAFQQKGHKLAIVGGPVRDAILARPTNDLDLTTDARPEVTKKILDIWADVVWEAGAEFGTIACKKGDLELEITTYRSEIYRDDSRKPLVEYGDTIEGDLLRRDFTINAMALELTTKDPRFIDLYEGAQDLAKKIIRTPASPEMSFSDDPLRMLRAIRFASQLNFTIEEKTYEAIVAMKERLAIISAERIREEFNKIILSDNPRIGLTLLVESGLAEIFIPELPLLQLEIDEHHHHKDVYEHTLKVLEQAIALEDRVGGKNLVMRLAALLHDIGKPRTRELLPGGGVAFHHHEVVGSRMTKARMRDLKYSKEEIEKVSTLVYLHLRFHGYSQGEWTDSAVRRYVRDAGDLLDYLHVLTRADCTTRNERKAKALADSYSSLEKRIEVLREQEELDSIRPDLNGEEIMQILGIKPSPLVGKAYNYMLELRLENGPMDEAAAKKALLAWWETVEK